MAGATRFCGTFPELQRLPREAEVNGIMDESSGDGMKKLMGAFAEGEAVPNPIRNRI